MYNEQAGYSYKAVLSYYSSIVSYYSIVLLQSDSLFHALCRCSKLQENSADKKWYVACFCLSIYILVHTFSVCMILDIIFQLPSVFYTLLHVLLLVLVSYIFFHSVYYMKWYGLFSRLLMNFLTNDQIISKILWSINWDWIIMAVHECPPHLDIFTNVKKLRWVVSC